MGNHASKQAEKEREAGGTPSSPARHHSSSSSAPSRKEPRAGSIRRHHHTSTDTSASVSPTSDISHKPGQSFSTTVTSPQTSLDERMGNQHSKSKEERDKSSKTKATPVKVPRGSDPKRQRGPDTQFEPSGPPRDPNFIPHSNLNFPPRLPLPIEQELHTPGSPILTAQGDVTSALHQDDVEGLLPRQSSTISNTTIEDEEIGNDVLEDQRERVDGYVPTTVYWKQGGDKVYVTGTFAQWSTKIRMYKDPKTGHHSAVLQLRPGTHHVKFIVDGEMQLSNDLETAADFTNILVNYIEVSADDIPTEGHHRHRHHEKGAEGVYPQSLPKGTDATDHAPNSMGKTQPGDPEIKAEPVFWGRVLPPYLHDVEKPEQTNRYQRSAKAVNDFSTPPGLPLFLGKSILNGTTPMKDDASVLNMPNHTVLNHLATSSIKNGMLATSITTRYIRKYVTTIMYKPTEDGD